MKQTLILLYEIFIWFPILLAITMLTAVVTIVGCAFGGERFFSYFPAKWWSMAVCMITFCPVKVVGREYLDPKQSYIFVSNHQSAFDIWLIFGYLNMPIKWMMKQSLRKIPVVGKACESAGFIFVDNSSPKAIAKTLRDAEEKLQNGNSVVIFPEGSRTYDGQMTKFKKGAFQLALDLQLPIVPLTINGAYNVMPRTTYRIHPHRMQLTIHPPIPPHSHPISNMEMGGFEADGERNDRREVIARLQMLSDQSRETIASALQ